MSRYILQWFNLTPREGQDLRLKIPICAVYSQIIDRAFPEITHIGWREGDKGTCYTFIKRMTQQEQDRLTDFLELLHEIRCLTLTQHLAPFFQRELDEAYALDFNFQPNVFPLAYTEAGSFEHLAKENQNSQAITELGRRLAEVIKHHPTLARSDFIAPMPPRPSKGFHLPVQLVNAIGTSLGRKVGLNLTKSEHPKLRSLPMERKVSALEGVFALAESVRGKTVLLIDDLYQSGVTAWTLAKFLKSQGARQVYALACVKSWSDTDNV